MEDKRSAQLSLDFGKDSIPVKSIAAPPKEEIEEIPSTVYSFCEKKAERNRAEEQELYRGILGLVQHFK